MKIEKIKPIPKYMIKKIRSMDKKLKPERASQTRFYSYLAKNDGELIKVTVAVKEKNRQWYYKQVAVHGIHSKECFVKDMEFSYVAGYYVGWHDQGISKYVKWFEDGKWYIVPDKLFDPYAPLVNKEYITTHCQEYKYSAVELYTGCEILKYLRLYKEYPQMEYLMKLGLQNLAFSKQILKLVGKDIKFRRWIAKNGQELDKYNILIPAVLKAYKMNRPVSEMQRIVKAQNELKKDACLTQVRELFKDELEKFFSYIAKQKTNVYSYADYLKSCNYLGIDMSKSKNRYPHDFKRWHDIRADEYKTAKALKDEEERKEFYEKFATVAQKYLGLEYDNNSVYIAVIPHKPSDLMNEGEVLHHCVGQMGYDQKFAREETIIFFIRAKEQPDVPLVTVEYSPKQKRVLQCYGDRDSKPSEDIMTFVNKKWLPYANRQLTKVVA